MHKLYGLISLLALVFCPLTYAEFGASLVLINGKIYTVDEYRPIVQAVYIKKGRIAALGRTEEILRKIAPGTQVVELKGRAVVPGFIDSHGHMLSLGISMVNLDFTGTESYSEVTARVEEQEKR